MRWGAKTDSWWRLTRPDRDKDGHRWREMDSSLIFDWPCYDNGLRTCMYLSTSSSPDWAFGRILESRLWPSRGWWPVFIARFQIARHRPSISLGKLLNPIDKAIDSQNSARPNFPSTYASLFPICFAAELKCSQAPRCGVGRTVNGTFWSLFVANKAWSVSMVRRIDKMVGAPEEILQERSRFPRPRSR